MHDYFDMYICTYVQDMVLRLISDINEELFIRASTAVQSSALAVSSTTKASLFLWWVHTYVVRVCTCIHVSPEHLGMLYLRMYVHEHPMFIMQCIWIMCHYIPASQCILWCWRQGECSSVSLSTHSRLGPEPHGRLGLTGCPEQLEIHWEQWRECDPGCVRHPTAVF